MSIYLSIVIKLIAGMLGVLIFLRFTGKTQMANLTPLDTVNTIVLGALVGSILYMPDTRVWVLLFAIAIWTILNIAIRLLLKINFFDNLIHGKTEFLIKDGKINIKVLDRNNLGMNQFRAKLRENGIYSLLDVDEVLFETDGQFTIIKKKDTPQSYLLVSNGEILKETLEEAGKDESWLIDKLSTLGYDDIKKILCAEYTPDRGFYIIDMDGNIMNKSKKTKVKELDKDNSI